MARSKAPERPPATRKLRIGRCLARCKSCGHGPCKGCAAFRPNRYVGGYLECLCGHTQQMHAWVEVPA